MNTRVILLFILVLLLRLINSQSAVDSTIFDESPSIPAPTIISHPMCSNLSEEEQERQILKKNLTQWHNTTTPMSITPWSLTNCLTIQKQQEQIYAQLQISKPTYQVKKQLVIAVIDTGIDYTNPELNSRIFRPEGWNLPTDFKGFDLVHQDFLPMDKQGHGTHVAGIIVGLFPEAKLLPIKFYEHEQARASMGIAIRLAVHMGANIINISGGGYGLDEYEQEAVDFAQAKGVLIVAAAGNDHKDIDQRGDEYYPASYGTDNIISVMAHDSTGVIAPYSNFGITHADVSALGTMMSYLPQSVNSSCSGIMNGTSQATPIITATAAMLWANNPQMSYLQIKNQVLKGVDTSTNFILANHSQGQVNIDRAISGQLVK
jgi:subtilisin family serine protease